MATCLICSNTLLRQIRSGKRYFFCRTCRLDIQENPEIRTGHGLKNQDTEASTIRYYGNPVTAKSDLVATAEVSG
jgi:hypothetical protein